MQYWQKDLTNKFQNAKLDELSCVFRGSQLRKFENAELTERNNFIATKKILLNSFLKLFILRKKLFGLLT